MEGSSLSDFLAAVDPSTGQLRPDAVSKTPDVTPTEEVKPAETVAQTPETETPQQQAETPVTPEKAEKVSEKETDWREVLSKVDRKEALKQLGLDDFDIDFSEKRKAGVDPYRFLEVKTRDWSKIKDLDVLKHDLKQQYRDLSEDDFDILAEDRLSRYNIEAPEQPDELATDEEKAQYAKQKAAYDRKVKLVQIELKTEADRLRNKYKTEDEQFLIPDKKADEEAARQAEFVKKEIESINQYLRTNEVAQNMMKDKVLLAGEGNEVYKVPVDPQKILDVAVSDQDFFKMFAIPNENGEDDIDTELLYATINYAMNRKAIEKGLIDYGKSLGVKSESDDIHNIPKAEKAKPGEVQESLLEAFTKRGKPMK